MEASRANSNTSGLSSPVLRTKEAADYLNVSQMTLRRWREQHIGPKWLRPSSALILYRQADLDAWLRHLAEEADEREEAWQRAMRPPELKKSGAQRVAVGSRGGVR